MIRLGEASKEHNQDWYNEYIELGNGVIMPGKGVIRLVSTLVDGPYRHLCSLIG